MMLAKMVSELLARVKDLERQIEALEVRVKELDGTVQFYRAVPQYTPAPSEPYKTHWSPPEYTIT